ncbi:prepilin peptidase [bacterium]|nr:prepilin peptidase [candidate division CSSED10-310 bacterium]
MEFRTFAVVFTSLTGLAVGSFLNVLIYRIPAGKSIVFPGSHCPNCSHAIRYWENIPVLSYVFLKGRCHQCGTKISLQYPFVELLTGVLFGYISLHYISVFESWDMRIFNIVIYCLFTAVLLALSVIDYHTKLLPDVITLPSALAAGGLSLASLHPWVSAYWAVTPYKAFLGILTGAGPLIIIAWGYLKMTGREGMGMGDIKLMIFVGALLGPLKAGLTIFLGALIGTIVGVPASIAKGRGRHFEIPFGPFLSLGAWIAALWGTNIINWYLEMVGLY